MSRLTRGVCAGVALVSGAAFVERVTDPFDRQKYDYVVEGPPAFSEVFYFSTNYYHEGEKHDDRIGDAYALGALAFGGAFIAMSIVDGRPRGLGAVKPQQNLKEPS